MILRVLFCSKQVKSSRILEGFFAVKLSVEVYAWNWRWILNGFGSSRMPIQSQAGRIQFKVKKLQIFSFRKKEVRKQSYFQERADSCLQQRDNGDRVDRQQVLLGGVSIGGITLFPRSLNKTKKYFSIQTLSFTFFFSAQDKQHRQL